MGLDLIKFLNVATHFSVDQFIHGNSFGSSLGSAVLFYDFLGIKAVASTESSVQRPCPIAITLTEFAFRIATTNLNVGDLLVMGVRQNGVTIASQNINSTFAAGSYTRVTGLNVNIAVTDLIDYIIDATGVPGARQITIDQWVIAGKIAIA